MKAAILLVATGAVISEVEFLPAGTYEGLRLENDRLRSSLDKDTVGGTDPAVILQDRGFAVEVTP